MESNVDKTETKVAEAEQQHQAEVSKESAGSITTFSGSEKPSSPQPWQEWLEPVNELFNKFPDYLNQYKQPLIFLALFISSVVAVKVTLAVLSSINEVPLLAPIFELVGLGYTGWFIYRYLLRASSRQELVKEFKSLKSQVAGENTHQE